MLSYVLTSNNRGVKTRLKMNVFFWKSIENEVGNVLPHIKNTLELEGLAGNAALGKLDLEDIKSMEQQMRFRVERIRRIVDSDATKSLEDFYGDYAGQPDLFKFTAGDIRVLQTLAAAVKRNGLQKYLAVTTTPCPTPSKAINALQHFGICPVDEHSGLVDRLLRHFEQRY